MPNIWIWCNKKCIDFRVSSGIYWWPINQFVWSPLVRSFTHTHPEWTLILCIFFPFLALFFCSTFASTLRSLESAESKQFQELLLERTKALAAQTEALKSANSDGKYSDRLSLGCFFSTLFLAFFLSFHHFSSHLLFASPFDAILFHHSSFEPIAYDFIPIIRWLWSQALRCVSFDH